ncbi:hypothetical protein BDV36DRAFT_284717 [Aspergillus pseudocaelatus]|uniref:Uncharacterized protein n=1 Tax=Aspergillus pseudocaelatus TaxID=1825620 RepID=A0ABQ6WGC1_9EURO|nr:hypothetical protein BDV36DRAFT_284717 [Aspergillus pseudocaelatus]
MDTCFAPYLRLAEHSQQSGTPSVSLELNAPETLFLESYFGIQVVLRRNDADPRPCIFLWPPCVASRFVLLRHTSGGLERVEVANRWPKPPDMIYLKGWCQDLFELQPNGSSRYSESLYSYRSALRPGERYELLWTGGEISIWDWGNVQDHVDIEMRRRDPCLFIAGGPHVSFTGPKDSTPITFHTFNLLSGNIQRRRGQTWEYFESEEMPYQIYDDPDIEVTPGQHPDFVSLYPGESWTRTDNLELPSDTEVGEVFKYEFSDRVIDWWDWGMKEDHLQTTVKLPCWVKDDVVEPKDNEGRPAIVVPPSNVVEFTIV